MTRTAGIWGMSGSTLFFLGLQIEYRFGLFPPGSGPLFTINQVQFLIGMGGIGIMLWGLHQMRAAGSGWFGRISLALFALAWWMLILGGLTSLLTGNADNLFYPLGGLGSMLFGLLAAIAIALKGQWRGWARFAPLLQSVYYLLVMMILPAVLTGSLEPTLLTESLWMVTWFVLSLAVWQQSEQRSDAAATALQG